MKLAQPSCARATRATRGIGTIFLVTILLRTRRCKPVLISLLGWNIFLIYQYLINIRLLFLTFWDSNYTFVYPWCNHLISKRNLFEKNNCFVSNFLKTYSSFRPLFFLAFFCKKTTSLLLAQQKIQKYLEGFARSMLFVSLIFDFN